MSGSEVIALVSNMETDGKANVVVAFLGSIAIITSHRYESQQFYFAVFDFVLKILISNCTFQQEPSGIKNILFLIFLLTLKKNVMHNVYTK